MATTTQLSFHLSIFPPTQRHPQKTRHEHERPIWSGHTLASCQTQVHSTPCPKHPHFGKVSKPSGILELGSNTKARFEQTKLLRSNDGWSYSLLCSPSTGEQHPGTFPYPILECHRCLYQMVEWKACSQGYSTPGPMVLDPESSIATEAVPPKMASENVGPPGSLPHSVLQNSVHQTCRSS